VEYDLTSIRHAFNATSSAVSESMEAKFTSRIEVLLNWRTSRKAKSVGFTPAAVESVLVKSLLFTMLLTICIRV
jgi:hypothetical protein